MDRQRTRGSIAAAVAALIIAGCAAGDPAGPRASIAPEPSPAAATTATATPSPAPTPAPTRRPAAPTTPAPTPPPPVPAGTWTGKVLEPTGEIHEWHEFTLVITPCARGEACGTWKGEGTSVTTGKAAGCSGTLTFIDAVVLREQADVMGGKLNFTFKESVSESHGLRYGCNTGREFLEVLPDGTSLRYRAKFWTGDDTFIAEGTLYRTDSALSPTARPSRAPAVPNPPTPPPELPTAMVGTWDGNPTRPEDAYRAGSTVPLRYTVTLRTCAIGEECGQVLVEGVDATGASMGCTWTMKYAGQYVDVRPGAPQDAVETVGYLEFVEGPATLLGSWPRVACSGWECKDYLRLRPGSVIDFMANCKGSWQEFVTLAPAP